MGAGGGMAQLNRNAVGLFGSGSNMGNLTPQQKQIFEYYYPSSNGGLFSKLASVVGTLVGSAIGMPMLGAALGGAMGGGATGGLKGAALGGLAGGAGAGLGGAISSGLGSLASYAPNAAGAVASTAGSAAGGSAVNAGLGNVLDELVVTPAVRGGLGSAIGSALGSTATGALTNAALNNANAGAPGPTTTSGSPAPSGPNEVAPITVMGKPLTPVAPPLSTLGGIAGATAFTQPNDLLTSEGSRQDMTYDLQHNQPIDWRGMANDTVGDLAGGSIADYGTLQLAKLLGWIPSTKQAGGGATGGFDPSKPSTLPKAPGTGTGFDPSKPSTQPLAPQPGTTVAPGQTSTSAAAPGLMSTGAPSASGGSGAAAPTDINTQGGLAPDVYPWRKAMAR